jgi:hypothetical protein
MSTSCTHLETMCSWSRPVIGLRGLMRVSLYFLPSKFWDAPLEFCRWAVGQGSIQHRNPIQISPSRAIPAFPPANSTRSCRRNLEHRDGVGRRYQDTRFVRQESAATLSETETHQAHTSAVRSAAGRPREDDKWLCTCGNEWSAFDTGGVCPACVHQWNETQCQSCSRWSAHSGWYER